MIDPRLRGVGVVAGIAASVVGGAWLMLRNHAPVPVHRARRFSVAASATAPMLAVTVIDELGGAVAGARVERLDVAGEVRTAGDGRARLAARPGELDLVVSAAGFATGTVHTTLVGSASAFTVVLRPGRAVHGRVVDAGGAPIAGAEIAPIDSAAAPVRSDAGGGFVVGGLGAGTVTLAVRDGEHAPAVSAPVVVGDRDVIGVALTMAAGGVVRGRVVDRDGVPVAHAAVRVAGHDAETQTTIDRELVTGRDGRFEARGLPRVLLAAVAETDAATSEAIEVDLAAAPIADAELALRATSTITGRVVGPDGDAVPGALVHAVAAPLGTDRSRPELSAVIRATCDDDGRFAVRGVAAGARYELAASGGRGLSPDEPRVVTAGARDVRIALIVTGVPRHHAAVDLPLAQVDRARSAPARAMGRSRARGR